MFTPGPWRVGEGGVVLADTHVGIYRSMPAAEAQAVASRERPGFVVAESVSPGNAALIAIAPEMYDLLSGYAWSQYGGDDRVRQLFMRVPSLAGGARW